MNKIWCANILENINIVQKNLGAKLVIIVSGSETDKRYWWDRFKASSKAVFRNENTTKIISIREQHRKGNFLGTLNAWSEAKNNLQFGQKLPQVDVINMVFGKGKRLSPFTQALSNRKPAFLTPKKPKSISFNLCTAELAMLYSNMWFHRLKDGGFNGLIVKWGDEAIIPGIPWSFRNNEFKDIDAIRFVWKTEITETFAREKDWVLADSETGLMKYQFARQNIDSLRQRLSEFNEGSFNIGVNLGSVAASYAFLETALESFKDDVANKHLWVDWDPYVWIALFCKDEQKWRLEAEKEGSIGRKGIRKLENRYPNFYNKIREFRRKFELKAGRPLAVALLDFGEAFWVDFGLHYTLRESFESVTKNTERGIAYRELFGIPHQRDEKGNIIINSTVPKSADIQNAVIIDSIITGKRSVIHGGLIVGGKHKEVQMPFGGSALFCAGELFNFKGPHAISFRSIGASINLNKGDRHTTLFLPDKSINIVSNESIIDYNGENYTTPILGNLLSFKRAGEIMAEMDGNTIEKRWLSAWQSQI